MSAQSDEPRGLLFSDVVGIGKTDTVLLKRIAICNERDIKMQKLRDAEDWDGLAAFPAPRPLFFITQPHLVQQAAMDAAAISSKNRVYIYGRDPEMKNQPANLGIISESLARDHKIFSEDDPTNSRVIVVVSYNRLLTRNGELAVDNWLKKTEPGASKETRKELLAKGLPTDWPGNLANLVDSVILDECQATKGLGSKSTVAIEYLNSDWCDLVSATPIPWKFQDFGGLLNFIQNPLVNRRAKDLIEQGKLSDPYLIDPETGLLVHPELEKFCYTLSAFQRFICQANVDRTEVGRRIGMMWQKLMIRREYSDSYVIDHKGTRHTIGDAMPVARSVRLHLTNTNRAKAAYLEAVQEQLGQMVVPDEKNENVVRLNGRMVRQLNLFSIHPHLKYAHSILNVKVCHPNDVALPDDEQRMIPNPELDEFTRLYNDRQDVKFLRKLVTEMRSNSIAEAKVQVHYPKFYPTLPKAGHSAEGVLLATHFLKDSIRFRALVANLTDQVVVSEKKSLVYCQHPFEQQLVTVILRLLSFKAEALLATHAATAKSELIPRFNARLSKHCTVGSAGYADSDSDLEIMVLSYYMNSGLNLQYQCPFLNAFSPPISESVWQQTCGRIVRFGQPSECLVLEYFVTGTFNQKQIATATNNAFVSHAALTLGGIAPLTRSENENDMGFQSKMADLLCWVRFDGKMYDNRDPSTPEEIRALQPLSLDDVILHKLQSKGPLDVKTRMSDGTSSENQNIESVKIADQPMFVNYVELAITSTNPKKSGTTPTKPRVSASPVSHKDNLESIIALKTGKAVKRKAAFLSKAKTPTKRTKTNRTVDKQLEDIDEEGSDEEMPDSSPLTGHGKNSHGATRGQLDDAIDQVMRPHPGALGDVATLSSEILPSSSELSDPPEIEEEAAATPTPNTILKLKFKNASRVQQPVFDPKKQQLVSRKAPSRATTRQTKRQLSKKELTLSDMEEDNTE